ncbi:hypothetical protein AA0121_g12771 [Alternaria tenuissima]|nr:hypothetical protein AA0121_g12771 [Alternaria tenuissima]
MVNKEHFTTLCYPAREREMTKKNILAGWAKSCLFPFNPDRVLRDITTPVAEAPTPLPICTACGGSGPYPQHDVFQTPVTPVSSDDPGAHGHGSSNEWQWKARSPTRARTMHDERASITDEYRLNQVSELCWTIDGGCEDADEPLCLGDALRNITMFLHNRAPGDDLWYQARLPAPHW